MTVQSTALILSLGHDGSILLRDAHGVIRLFIDSKGIMIAPVQGAIREEFDPETQETFYVRASQE